ncbi:MAG: phosphoribosylanthranilate isomerase [Ignavibacteriae bacterium]|nr:phosphoribosylanthranilate isomerase [Ignavibacteriota bacterium]
MKVKICGITNIEDAMLCYNLGADAIGFIFYERSERYITPEKAKEIIEKLPAFILKVGVFVNESSEKINSISKEIKLNLVQLHGDETPEEIIIIDLPVIKAFRVDDTFDYSILSEYKNCSFLLDSFDKKDYGGTGKKFDWDKIPNELKNKIILAGGVSTDSIEYICKNVKPSAIDASSSLEIIPGKKDKQKIDDFFKEFNKYK